MRRKVWSDNDLHHALGSGSAERIEFGAEGGEDSAARRPAFAVYGGEGGEDSAIRRPDMSAAGGEGIDMEPPRFGGESTN